jgi:hypothetical protein
MNDKKPLPILNLDPARFVRNIAQIVEARLQKVAGAFGKAKVPSGYTTGNPTMQLPEETTATLGTRTHPVLQIFGPWGSNAIAANDPIIYGRDGAGNRVPLGKLVNASDLIIDAQAWGSVGWVQPGAATSYLTAPSERSTTSASYVDVKRFVVGRPGRYRVNLFLSRSGGQADAKVQIERNDGSRLDASSVASYNGAVNPTFGGFTLDMNQTIWPGQFIVVQYKNDGASTAYIKDVTVSFSEATGAQTPYSATITD